MTENLKLTLTDVAQMGDGDLFVLKDKCERCLKVIDYEIEQRYFRKITRQREIPVEAPRNIAQKPIVKKASGAKRGRKPGKKNIIEPIVQEG